MAYDYYSERGINREKRMSENRLLFSALLLVGAFCAALLFTAV
jgi:hypothetical protein